MRYATTALRCWLTAAALLLALCCPLPVFAARAGAVLPVTVRTEGAAADAACVVSITPLDAAPAPAQATLEDIERQAIAAALVRFGGNISQTAFALGVSRPTLYRKMSKYGLEE